MELDYIAFRLRLSCLSAIYCGHYILFPLPVYIQVFNLRMAQVGAYLIHYRAHFIKRLQEHAPAIHADFSGGREGLKLNYDTVSTVNDPKLPPRELLPLLLAHQEKHRQAEIDSRQCLSGPHKDDLTVQAQALKTPAKYIGVIGSRKKTAAVFAKLRDMGYTDADLQRITTPIGLSIKAETPAEIAVSIAAQLIQLRAETK